MTTEQEVPCSFPSSLLLYLRSQKPLQTFDTLRSMTGVQFIQKNTFSLPISYVLIYKQLRNVKPKWQDQGYWLFCDDWSSRSFPLQRKPPGPIYGNYTIQLLDCVFTLLLCPRQYDLKHCLNPWFLVSFLKHICTTKRSTWNVAYYYKPKISLCTPMEK